MDAAWLKRALHATTLERVASETYPRFMTWVLDAALIRGWALLEANAAWGAGLNGCDPRGAMACIAEATHLPR